MEDSESEAIFDSLNLNPQLFFNEVLNTIDELFDGAFDFFHQQASDMLQVESTDRAEDLRKGVLSVRRLIQSPLDKRLDLWKLYSLKHCFAVPEGFSLPEANDESARIADLDSYISNDGEQDAKLDSLRHRLVEAGKESDSLNRELQELERQSSSIKHCAEPVKEALQLSEESRVMFQELTKVAAELRERMQQMKRKRPEEHTGDHEQMSDYFSRFNRELSNVTVEQLEDYVAHVQKNNM
ncbi:protein MIS12 homolog [Impatiens glandulifera]|uniref:protein MIS12 homolog n=1 Tax=Impatiens glandulifera TaxID=253017 RepID=UPI001FB0EEEE|nr:protein MIS12 homolog [Impatiens glandulifera]